jgi:tetratricopeptide (TPR) repeat protein
LFFLFAGTIFAQEKSAAELKNEGNEALRNKDYKKAFELYDSAITNWGDDTPLEESLVYNTATCARRIENYDQAIKYYQKTIDMGFKADISSYYIAQSLNKLDKDDEMAEFLIKATEKYKTSKYLGHMKKMLVTHYLKQGAEPYNRASQILASAANADPSQYDEIKAKANEAFAEAKPWFEKALSYDAANANAKASLTEINKRLAGGK